MVVRDHPSLSLSRHCRLLSIGRSSLYYEPKGESAATLALMRRIDALLAGRQHDPVDQAADRGRGCIALFVCIRKGRNHPA